MTPTSRSSRSTRTSGLTAETIPVVSVSIAEEEVGGIGIDNIVGQLTAWNYYQTVDSPENATFVEAFKAKYGDDRVTSDPMEAAYTSLYLWKGMVEKAESFDVEDVPGGRRRRDLRGPRGHRHRERRQPPHRQDRAIGKIGPDGLINTEWSSDGPIEPDPFLEGYDWAEGLS